MNLKNAKELELKNGVTRRVTQVSQTLRTPGVLCGKRHLVCLPTWGCYCPQLYWSEFLTHPRRNAVAHCEGKGDTMTPVACASFRHQERNASFILFNSHHTGTA